MVELVRVHEIDRPALWALVDEYLLELANHREIPVGPTTAADYRYLPAYWSEPGRHPFFVTRSGERVGFLLVREVPAEGVIQMSDFYVQPTSRRSGIGREALERVFRRFPGAWELQVHRRNRPGLAFWSRSLEALCPGPIRVAEVVEEDGRRMQYNFDAGGA